MKMTIVKLSQSEAEQKSAPEMLCQHRYSSRDSVPHSLVPKLDSKLSSLL